MLQVSRKCLSDVLGVLVLKAPRAFHLGQCGLHHYGDCDDDMSSSSTLTAALASLRLAREMGFLYPKNLKVIENQLMKMDFKRDTLEVYPNGGWADPRDRELCLSFNRNK